MKRIPWIAKHGAQVEVGSVIAADERAAMKAVLASRAWRGRDWKLRVGDLHTTFDEEDVGLLTEQVGDEHARDDVGTKHKVASDRPKLSHVKEESFGVAPCDIDPGDLMHIDLGQGTIIDVRKTPMRYGVKLGMNDPDRLREMRAIMHGRAGEIECNVVMPCCKRTKQIRFPMPQSNTMRSKTVNVCCYCGEYVMIELEID